MSWFYEQKEYSSEKNGLIRCTRLLGQWYVRVGGYDQTTPYIRTMWKRALRRVPRQSGVKQVLLLGLGAGGVINNIRRRFPHCRITIVEWDPVMLGIAEKLRLFVRDDRTTIIVDDAACAIPALASFSFDVIIVDLFRGSEPSSALATSAFVSELARLLNSRGYLLLNVFKKQELFSLFDEAVLRYASWRYRYNRLALYRPWGNGRAGDPLPAGYQHYKQSREYLRGDCDPKRSVQVIGEEGCLGMRWQAGPFRFEGYETDVEPSILLGLARMIIWQPLTRRDKPAGWHRSFVQMNFRRTGFAEISNPSMYWGSWTSHAQRHRRRWLRDTRYVIEEVELETFVEAYQRVRKLSGFLRREFVKMVRRRYAAHGDAIHLFAARERTTGQLVAGLATVDFPDASHTHHLISFIHPSAASSSVGTGLIDYWFQHAISAGIRFLNFGVFWSFGDAWSWRGFSKFKSQFGIFYIHRPNPLVKFVKRGASQPRG